MSTMLMLCTRPCVHVCLLCNMYVCMYSPPVWMLITMYVCCLCCKHNSVCMFPLLSADENTDVEVWYKWIRLYFERAGLPSDKDVMKEWYTCMIYTLSVSKANKSYLNV